MHFDKKSQKIIIKNINTAKANTFLFFKNSSFSFSFMKKTEKFFWRFTHRIIMIYNYIFRHFIIPFILIFIKLFKIKII